MNVILLHSNRRHVLATHVTVFSVIRTRYKWKSLHSMEWFCL